MSGWSDVRIGDITTGLARYRPVAVTVAAILLIVAFAPGTRYARVRPAEASFTPNPTSPAPSTAPTTTVPAPGVSAPVDGGSGFSAAPGTGFDSSFTPTTSPSFDSGSSFSGDESAVAPETSFEPTPPSEVGADPGDGSTLGVVTSAWATATAGTPLGAEGVPEGTLPVGKRFGQDDKRSYVKLAGQGTVLTLTEDPAGARGPIGTGLPLVRACKVTSSWNEGGNKTFDEITFDGANCVDGLRDASGSWSFDMGVFSAEERVDDRGFALVPGGTDADIDYQVAFKTSP